MSLVTDAYSRKIGGSHVHDSLQTEQVAQALKIALRTRQSDQRLVHHSDRSIQYCSGYYQAIHHLHGLHCAMTDGYGATKTRWPSGLRHSQGGVAVAATG